MATNPRPEQYTTYYMTLPYRSTTERPTVVRVGVVVSSPLVPEWVRSTLTEIARSQFFDLTSITVKTTSGRQMAKPSGLFEKWCAFDSRLFRSTHDALRLVDASDEVTKAGNVECPDVYKIAVASRTNAAVDVVIDFDAGHQSSTALSSGNIGPAHYIFCPPTLQQFQRSAFWTMHTGQTVFETVLPVHSPTGRHDIYGSCSSTDPVSVYRNCNTRCWKMSHLVLRALSDISSGRAPTCASSDPQPVALSGTPGFFTMLSFIARWLLRVVRRKITHYLRREAWFVAFRPIPTATTAASEHFEIISPPGERFYADPFLIERAGQTFLFFEDGERDGAKAGISCLQLPLTASNRKPRPVLPNTHHLSYPFIFEYQDRVYLVPESREIGRIEAYCAEAFPDRWRVECVVMPDIAAVDPTLLQYAGRWWLFTSGVASNLSPNDELFLYFSDSPFGPWRAHPRNPIVSDVRRARPAGPFFVKDGCLIRPSQDCGPRYGFAVCLNRVEVLTPTEYREVLVDRIMPDWFPGNQGTHTFIRGSRFEAIDGRRLRLRRLSEIIRLLTEARK